MNRISVNDVSLVAAATGAWIGAAIGVHASLALVVVAPVALISFAAFRYRRATDQWLAGLLLVAVIAGCGTAWAGHWRHQAVQTSPLVEAAADGQQGRVTLNVVSDPVMRRDGRGGLRTAEAGVTLRANATQLTVAGASTSMRSPVLVVAPESWVGLTPGQQLNAWVKLVPADGGDLSALLVADAAPTLIGRPPRWQRGAERLRQGLRDSVAELPDDRRGLVPSLVVGDTSRLPERLVDDMRASGLSHLTAVSGTNVALLLLAALCAARWIGVRGRWLALFGLVTIGGFVVLARPEPSVLRAAVMGVIALAAAQRGGARRSLGALAAAVALLLAIDPWLALSAGFALSTAATAGLIALAPIVHRRLAGRIPGRWAELVAGAIAAQLMVSPIIALLSGRIEPGAVVANLLAEPAVAPATILGVIDAAVSPISPAAARFVGHLAGYCAAWIAGVAHWAARSPLTVVPWPAGWWGGLLLAALLVLSVAAWLWLVRTRRASTHHARSSWAPRKRVPMGWRSPLVGAGLSLVLIAAVLVGLPAVGARDWPPSGWRLVACDVGQGDALVLEAGRGAGILIDAGPDARKVDRCLKDLGISALPLVVLTHFHADHVDGLMGAIHGRAVGTVLVSPLDEPEGGVGWVTRTLAGRGLKPAVARLGAQAQLAGWTFTVLGPVAVLQGEESPPNNASVTMLAERDGVRFALLGDAEPEAQKLLTAHWGDALRDVDVLKVAHHGSRYQNLDLLRRLHPRLAVISVGADNRYGHPAASTVRMLESIGTTIGRTDRGGDLAVIAPSPDSERLIQRHR